MVQQKKISDLVVGGNLAALEFAFREGFPVIYEKLEIPFHLEQTKEQIRRTPFPLPDISLENVDILNGEFDYQILGYKSHSTIKAPLSN